MNNHNVYTEIMERIAAQVPEVQHLNEFNDQFSNPDNDYSFGFPAVALEFGESRFPEQGRYGTGELTLHIASDNIYDTHLDLSVSVAYVNTDGLESFALVKKVTDALRGFASANCHGFKRIAEPPKYEPKGLIVRKVTFSFGFRGC